MTACLEKWLEERDADTVWYLKRLSANDTLATGAHQAGPYIPKKLLLKVFPALNCPDQKNPRCSFHFVLASHSFECHAKAIWYNNRLRGGTRNEARITNLGGRESPILDPESTGALVAFAFDVSSGREILVHAWLARDEKEEEWLESRFGPIEPGSGVVWPPLLPAADGIDTAQTGESQPSDCSLSAEEIPPEWGTRFPAGEEIVAKALAMSQTPPSLPPDDRLIKRRECEFRIFESVERLLVLPRVRRGFSTVEDFLTYAQTVLQRRKARAGRSLELHMRHILLEEGLREDENFSYGAESEQGKKPDFLFPSQRAYRDPSIPADRLRMLAVKTTCRDRWRQILNEADRLSVRHLLTLQEGVSTNQFGEMKTAGVKLVVPKGLHGKFPPDVQPELLSLEDFLSEIKSLM